MLASFVFYDWLSLSGILQNLGDVSTPLGLTLNLSMYGAPPTIVLIGASLPPLWHIVIVIPLYEFLL
jgi:hypothetical protein